MPRLINQVSLTNKRAIQNQQEERRYVYDANHSLIRYGQKSEEGTHTIYEPGSFIPLIRIEGPKQAAMQSLAQKIEQQAGEKLSGEHLRLLDRIERQLRAGSLDARTEQHLIKIGATPQMMRDMLNDWPALEGKTIHYYHCDHLGTPTALINKDGEVDWSVELDAWGNVIKEHNPKNIDQPIRFQGQHFDEESGLHYNRHRYYDPKLGRYITQDPIGLRGGVNPSAYALNPVAFIDPLGLDNSNKLDIEEMETKIAANNNSGQSNNLILCMAWKETNFDPTQISSAANSTAAGLLQITKTGLNDLKKHNLGNYSYADMLDPDKNIAAGTEFLKLKIDVYAKGNKAAGIDKYGTRSGYSKDILDCEKCLNDCNGNKLGCKDDAKQNCLNKIHK